MKTISTNLFVILILFFSNLSIQAQSWEPQGAGLLPLGYGAFSISIVNENVVWAVAFDQNVSFPVNSDHITKVLKTTDGGLNWNVYDVTETTGRISFDIVAFDENTALITTQDFGSGEGLGVYKTEDGGVTWVQKLDHLAGGVWIRFFNSTEGVAINRQFIATTLDSGDTWQEVPSENIPGYMPGEFTIISNGNNSCVVVDDHIWFGTSKGRVFRSMDKGHNWEVFDTSFGSDGLVLSVFFKDTLNGIAIDAQTFTTTFSRTTDGGASWEDLPSSVPGSLSIAAVASAPGPDNVLIGVADIFVPEGLRGSAYSIDFGQTWQAIETNMTYGGTQFNSTQLGWSATGEIANAKQPTMLKWNAGTLVATEELINSEDYRVFPNPFTRSIFLESESNNNIDSYILYDNRGKLIKSGLVDSSLELNFGELFPGIYHLEIFAYDFKIVKTMIKAN